MDINNAESSLTILQEKDFLDMLVCISQVELEPQSDAFENQGLVHIIQEVDEVTQETSYVCLIKYHLDSDINIYHIIAMIHSSDIMITVAREIQQRDAGSFYDADAMHRTCTVGALIRLQLLHGIDLTGSTETEIPEGLDIHNISMYELYQMFKAPETSLIH